MGEVEPGLVGVDQRTLLLHMGPEHLSQGLVHDVRDRVVARRAGPTNEVHFGHEGLAHRDLPLNHAAVVSEDLG